jgi:hypothetical protein
MEYKNFETIILTYKSFWNKMSELSDMGFDFYEGKFKLMEDVEKMLYTSLESVYNEDGIDWLSWFMFENDFGKKDWSKTKFIEEDKKTKKHKYGAFNKKGKPIFYSLKNTWKLLEKEYKK